MHHLLPKGGAHQQLKKSLPVDMTSYTSLEANRDPVKVLPA